MMALNPALGAMVAAAAAKNQKPEEPAGFLDWMTPLGKPLRHCTGYEVGFIAQLITQQANLKLAAEAAARDIAEIEAAAGLPVRKRRVSVRAATQQVA